MVALTGGTLLPLSIQTGIRSCPILPPAFIHNGRDGRSADRIGKEWFNMVRRALSGSRYVIVLAVIGTLLSSLTLLVYGALTAVDIVIDTIRHHSVSPEGSKDLSIEFIELVDLFLLGTVLYIISIGLYELFIDDTLETPDWLHIDDLDDLKDKLIAVIVVLLGVTFLGSAVSWKGGRDILYYGLAIAAVLVPLGALQLFGPRAKKKASTKTSDSANQPETVDLS
jgi:uncharacterized membrane protein YqhA